MEIIQVKSWQASHGSVAARASHLHELLDGYYIRYVILVVERHVDDCRALVSVSFLVGAVPSSIVDVEQ